MHYQTAFDPLYSKCWATTFRVGPTHVRSRFAVHTFATGQRDILDDAMLWAEAENARVRERATQLGVDLDGYDDEEDVNDENM